MFWKKALKQLQWNQFLRRNKCIKQWTYENGPVSLLLNKKKVKSTLINLKVETTNPHYFNSSAQSSLWKRHHEMLSNVKSKRS